MPCSNISDVNIFYQKLVNKSFWMLSLAELLVFYRPNWQIHLQVNKNKIWNWDEPFGCNQIVLTRFGFGSTEAKFSQNGFWFPFKGSIKISANLFGFLCSLKGPYHLTKFFWYMRNITFLNTRWKSQFWPPSPSN